MSEARDVADEWMGSNDPGPELERIDAPRIKLDSKNITPTTIQVKWSCQATFARSVPRSGRGSMSGACGTKERVRGLARLPLALV